MQSLTNNAATVAVLSAWIVISACLIVFNAALLQSFRHPVLLTCWHQFVSVVLILLLRLAKPSLLYTGDDQKGIPPLTVRAAVQLAWPVAICQSVGLVCGNSAIMYLSVAFCQMIKSFTAGSVYIAGCFLGTQEWSMPKIASLFIITLGLVITSWGELNFSWLGFTMQVTALVTEGLRINIIELRMKSAGYKLNALSSVQVFAPLVCLLLFICALFIDRAAFDMEQIDAIGKWIFLANASVAFLLNLVIYMAIQCASGLTYALAGVVKDVLIVIGGSYFQGTSLTAAQVAGYGVALAGLQVYGQVTKSPADFEEGFLLGIYRQFIFWTEEKNRGDASSGSGSHGTEEELLTSPQKESGVTLDDSTTARGEDLETDVRR